MAQMTQAEIDRILTPDMAHGLAGKKTIKNPKFNATDLRSTEPETLDVDVQQWVAPDGRVIQAVQMPDGSWDLIRNEPKSPTGAGANNPNTPGGKNAAELQRQREANRALPLDQDPAYETDEDRRKRGAERIRQQGSDALAADERARRDRLDTEAAAERARAGGRADSAEARAAAAASQPDVKTETVVKEGKTYTRQISTPKNGGPPTIRTFGPDGKELPGGVPGDSQIPTNLPPFVPDWNKPGLGIYEWAAMVRARPDITDEKKAQIITSAHQDVSGTIAQGNAVLSAQQAAANQQTSERGQNVSMTNSRLGAASSDFGTSVRAAADATKFSEGPEAASVLPYLMAMGRANGQGYGGFNTPPPVAQGAAITQMQGQTIPGMGQLAGVATPPNAIGLGAIGPQPAPGMPPPVFRPAPVAPPPGMSALAASAPPPTAGEPGGPPLAAGPVAPTPPGGGTPLPPQAQGPYPSVNPVTGEPTGLQPPTGQQVTIRHKQTGQTRQVPLVAFNTMPDRDQYDVLDPNSGGSVSPASTPTASPPSLLPPMAVPDTGGAYAPQMAAPGTGATGDGRIIGGPSAAPLPHEMQPPPGASGALPWMPQGMVQGNGSMANLLANAGPWAPQPQAQQQAPTGQGAMLMQRAGGYDPSGLNRILADAGIDPEIVAMMGGVG